MKGDGESGVTETFTGIERRFQKKITKWHVGIHHQKVDKSELAKPAAAPISMFIADLASASCF